MPRVKFYRNELQYAARWMLDYLIRDPSKTSDVILKVYIRNISRGDYLGRMIDDYVDQNKFVVVLDSTMGRKLSLQTLAHEIVHVAQYLNGKIKHRKSNGTMKVYWKRKKILDDKKEEDFLTSDEYFALPWEVEAYRLQTRVSRAYQRHLKKCQKIIITNRSL